MDIRPIRTDRDHRAALREIEACWGAQEGSEKGDRLEVLVALVESYETRRRPIDGDKNFDPIDVLHYAIEELGETAKLYQLLRGLNPRYLSPAQVADLSKTFGLTLPEHGHE